MLISIPGTVAAKIGRLSGAARVATAARAVCIVVSVAGAFTTPDVMANWLLTESLANGRIAPAVTPLADGRVLVTGGTVDGGQRQSAEIYDPVRRAWTAAADMNTGREGHTATLLATGEVLVAGGYTGAERTASAELYDPASDTWTDTGSMAEGRFVHTGTRLADGRVLVAGGADSGPLASAELFDPDTGTWSATGNDLAYARNGHTATLLADGDVLVIAGSGTDPEVACASGGLLRTERYDPTTNMWQEARRLQFSARIGHTATLLPDGHVLLAGGQNCNNQTLGITVTYDPDADEWSRTATDLTTVRYDHATTLLPDGTVIATGGTTSGAAIRAAETYDPITRAWASAAQMIIARRSHATALLPDGRLLAVAGRTFDGSISARTELYETPVAAWEAQPLLPLARRGHTSTLLPDGRVLVAGGAGPTGANTSAVIYDPSDGTWEPTPDLPTNHSFDSATLLPDGRILKVALFSSSLYDQATGAWTSGPALPNPRSGGTATLLADGRVLYAGGNDVSNTTVADAALFDPWSETWQPTGSMTEPRIDHTATLLPDGRVLVTGGDGRLASAELYDPTTGTFSSTQPMATGRRGHAAVLLKSGDVLVAGGGIGNSRLERYAPDTDQWTTVAVSGIGGSTNAGTLLRDGRVLFINNDGERTFDPRTNALRTVSAGLDPVRGLVGSSYLPDHGVLITGGLQPGILASLDDVQTLRTLGTVDTSRRSNIDPVDVSPIAGELLTVTGSGFGNPAEASGGNSTRNAAANHPIVEIRRIDNAQITILEHDPDTPWTDNSVTVNTAGLARGPVLLSVITAGIISHARVVLIDADTDGDGVGDNVDNCPDVDNAGQNDLDDDGQGNACDDDLDGDGVTNEDDAFPRDATETADADADGVGDNADTDDDNDRIPDTIETAFGLDPFDPADADGDADGDGFTNLEEHLGAGGDITNSVFTPAIVECATRLETHTVAVLGGRIDDGDCELVEGAGRRADRFVVVGPGSAAGGGTLTIDVSSQDVDPSIYVYSQGSALWGSTRDTGDTARLTVDLGAAGPQRRTIAIAPSDPGRNGTFSATLSFDGMPDESVQLATSILPTSRSVQVGTTATAFSTVINLRGSARGNSCAIFPMTGVPATFFYQTTDPATNEPTGTPDSYVAIEQEASQSYVFGFTPYQAFPPTDVVIAARCIGSVPAPVVVGLNTLLLSASTTPIPDIVALSATPSNDGILDIPGVAGSAAFAVATSNVGAEGALNVIAIAENESGALPLTLALCETDPLTSLCVNPAVPSTAPVLATVAAGATPTFAVFATASQAIPFDPANNRITVRFADDQDIVRGATSIAVRTGP